MTQPKIEGVGHGIPRMLYASDGSNWYAVLVDSDGHVKVDVVAYPGSNALGNFPFGYNNRYSATGINLTPGAAPTSITLPDVDAGEVWVVNTIWGMNGSRTDNIQLKIIAGSDTHYLLYGASGGAAAVVIWNGAILMKADDYITVSFWANQAGDDLYCGALGYKMKIA